MEVNGFCQHSLKYHILCSTAVRNSFRFEPTWGWGNDVRFFIFWWTVPLKIYISILIPKWWNGMSPKHSYNQEQKLYFREHREIKFWNLYWWECSDRRAGIVPRVQCFSSPHVDSVYSISLSFLCAWGFGFPPSILAPNPSVDHFSCGGNNES